MTTVTERESQAQLDERAMDTPGRHSSAQTPFQDEVAHVKAFTPEHAKMFVKYPTPLWMLEHDPKGAGNYETFWVRWKNVSLLLDHYLPGTLIDSEVIHATDDDVSHVKVTLTAMNTDGTIAKRVSAISGQRSTNKSGRNEFAEAKAQSYAFKNAAVMLGICADMSILLDDPIIKHNVRQGKYKHSVRGNTAQSNSHPASNGVAHSQPVAGAQARSAPKKAAPKMQPQPSRQPTGASQSVGDKSSSKVDPINGEGLDQKRNRLRDLAQQMGMSEDGMQKRISDSYGKKLEELPESDLDYLINASIKHLSQ